MTELAGFVEGNMAVLVFHCSEETHDHGSSHKGKCLAGAGVQFQRFNLFPLWRQAWGHAGRRGAGEGAEGSTFRSAASR